MDEEGNPTDTGGANGTAAKTTNATATNKTDVDRKGKDGDEDESDGDNNADDTTISVPKSELAKMEATLTNATSMLHYLTKPNEDSTKDTDERD